MTTWARAATGEDGHEPVVKPEKWIVQALAARGKLVFLDFITDQTENVYPMIVAGAGHHEMHLSTDRELA